MNVRTYLLIVSYLFTVHKNKFIVVLAHEESENRYSIKVPNGETIYYASEISSSFQRMCFGASRSFTLKLYDRTHQEALEIKRRLACGTCSFWCYLQVFIYKFFFCDAFMINYISFVWFLST